LSFVTQVRKGSVLMVQSAAPLDSNKHLTSPARQGKKPTTVLLLQSSATPGKHPLGASSRPWSWRQKTCWQHGIWLLQAFELGMGELASGPSSWLMHTRTSVLMWIVLYNPPGLPSPYRQAKSISQHPEGC